MSDIEVLLGGLRAAAEASHEVDVQEARNIVVWAAIEWHKAHGAAYKDATAALHAAVKALETLEVSRG